MDLEKLISLKNESGLPGFLFQIGDIPTVIVQDHNEVFPYWSLMRKAHLLHVDGHSDMLDGASLFSHSSPEYYKSLSISDFIAPAVHLDFVSKIHWLNPHAPSRSLQYMGDKKNGFPSIRTYVTSDSREEKVYWSNKLYHDKAVTAGKVMRYYELTVLKPFILDIDLDAFCCQKSVSNVPVTYEGIAKHHVRLERTVKLLKNLITPDLITISRSRGTSTYVPTDKVHQVQKDCVNELSSLYGPILSNGKKPVLPDDSYFRNV